MRVCGWAERSWPPDSPRADDTAVVVGRQLGTQRRRWDTVVIEADAVALARRAVFGADKLDSDLRHVVRHAPADWAWYRDALPDPGYPWRYVRAAVHRAAGRGVVEKRRSGNRIQIKRIASYPDWAERVVAIENKPDLTASAARDLATQIQRDVARGLADEVWVATAATGERIEPVLLEDMPVEAGVLVFDFDADDPASVAWHPRSLGDAGGTRIVDREGGEFEYTDPEAERERRRGIAERAYGRGWRSFADTMRPDCRHFHLRRDETGRTLVPWCGALGREQSGAECAGDCPHFEPEPPTWRQRGWPIEGGPGTRLKTLLDERRNRVRK
ncbi:MAG: DUF5787 family protein [Halobacteriaceae archaeon]